MTNKRYLESVSDQALLVDVRAQGLGLEEQEALDGYASKFYILSGSAGLFVAPRGIPTELTDYYQRLGIDIAPPEQIIAVGDDVSVPVSERMQHSTKVRTALATRAGSMIVPYMVTPAIESLAATYAMRLPTDATTAAHLADKATFQQKLHTIAPDIATATGLDIAIPSILFTAGDTSSGRQAYRELNHSGTHDVVVARPKSASALGVFMVRAERGFEGLQAVVKERFSEGDPVLLETHIRHNHSPSLQGAGMTGNPYKHLYTGRQFITYHNERIRYGANELPFGPATVAISAESTARILDIHLRLGKAFITANGISGVAGFDSVAQLDSQGNIVTFKCTELNMHLPSSLAVYAACEKMFPEGFDGIAHNTNVSTAPGQTLNSFMRQHQQLLVQEQQEYGVFPLNASYDSKVEVVLFAKDRGHLQQLKTALHI